MTLFEIKEKSGKVYLRSVKQRGSWGTPVVDKEGNFYTSLRDCSKRTGQHRGCILSRLARNEGLYWASGDLVRDFVRMENTRNERKSGQMWESVLDRLFAETPNIKEAAALHRIGTAAKPEVIVPVVPKPQHPFVGIEWPDLTVTVRLSTGGTWTLTRAKQADVPDEIRNHCVWGKL